MAELRKCKAGREQRPAWFHGWFQFGNLQVGCDAMGVVEFFCDNPKEEDTNE